MKRGSLYWVNLEPSEPPEFGKTRPALIVSNSEQNLRLASVVMVPLSTQSGEIWPLRVRVKVPGGKPSFAVIPGIRQISKSRLHKNIGQLPPGAMAAVDQAVRAYLSD